MIWKSQILVDTQPTQKTCKNRYQTSFFLSNFTGFPHCVPNILPKIVWENKVLVFTRPSLFQTLIFDSCVKLLKLMLLCIKYFTLLVYFVYFLISSNESFLESIFDLKLKINSRKLSLLLIGSFLTEVTFYNQKNIFFRNLNQHKISKTKFFRQLWS